MISGSVHEWLDIAQGNAKLPYEFEQFIASWEVIQCLYRIANPAGDDSALKSALVTELSGLDLPTDWTRATAALRRRGPVTVVNGRYAGQQRRIKSQTDFQGIVDVLYTIRCNLVHGGKNPGRWDDLEWCALAANVAFPIAKALTANGFLVPAA